MMTEKQIDEILAHIGREHREIGAPQKLESALRAAADSRKAALGKPALRPAWTWAAAMLLLTAFAVAAGMWQMRKSHESQNQQARTAPASQVKPEAVVSSDRTISHAILPSKSAPARSARTNRALHHSPQQATSNSLDEFVALPASEGLPPASQMSVVRVKLTGSDLQQYGLEAPADAVTQTLLAEFVVGEDGLPRAIRIIR